MTGLHLLQVPPLSSTLTPKQLLWPKTPGHLTAAGAEEEEKEEEQCGEVAGADGQSVEANRDVLRRIQGSRGYQNRNEIFYRDRNKKKKKSDDKKKNVDREKGRRKIIPGRWKEKKQLANKKSRKTRIKRRRENEMDGGERATDQGQTGGNTRVGVGTK